MPLDYGTLAIALSLSNLLQVAALFTQSKLVRQVPGLGWWTLGILCIALGFLAMFLRAAPDLTALGVFANNLLFVAGHLLLYVGGLRFFGRREFRPGLGGFFAGYILTDYYFVFVYNDILWRGSLLYLTISALSLLIAGSLWKLRPRSRSASALLVAAASVLHSLVFFAGFVILLIFPPPVNSPAAPSPAQLLGMLDGLAISTLWTFGFILMVNQRLANELQDQATTDSLTGLKNRRYFVTMAQLEVKRSARRLAPLAMVLLDLDHFKSINDRHGHPLGDQALITFARRCQKNLREIDLLARFGGDEFAVLLPDTSQEQAGRVVERIRQTISEQPFDLNGTLVPVTLSVGLAWVPAGNAVTFEELVVRCDQALYHAKQAGRNRVVVEAGAPPAAGLGPAA